MKNNQKLIRLAASLTALTLSCTLMTGCNVKKRDKFYFHPNLSGNMVIDNDSYISSEYINKYYVIEVYHRGISKASIYIAYRFEYTNGREITSSKYINIFNNYTILYDDDPSDCYDIKKVTPLLDYLTEYNILKDKYTYDDMQEILQTITDSYKYQQNDSLSKKLTINNRL